MAPSRPVRGPGGLARKRALLLLCLALGGLGRAADLSGDGAVDLSGHASSGSVSRGPVQLAQALEELARTWENCGVVLLEGGPSVAASSVADLCLELQEGYRAGGSRSVLDRRLHGGNPIENHHEWYVASESGFAPSILLSACLIVLCVLALEAGWLKSTLLNPRTALNTIVASEAAEAAAKAAVAAKEEVLRLTSDAAKLAGDHATRAALAATKAMADVGQGSQASGSEAEEAKAPAAAPAAAKATSASDALAPLVLRTPSRTTGPLLMGNEIFRWREDSSDKFWDNASRFAAEMHTKPTRSRPACEIRWARRDNVALESDGRTTVAVRRMGLTKGEVAIKFCTKEMLNVSNFGATNGHDYVHREATVTFQDGVDLMNIELELLQTGGWNPTRIFNVTLLEVVSGAAELGGPTTTSWDTQTGSGPTCRVYILQDDTFPANMPKDLLETDQGGFWLMWYYIKDRVATRGRKYWTCLRAMLFVPFHEIFISSLVIKFIIDVGASSEDGSMALVAGSVAVLFLSNLGLRYADYLEVTNRGRTGGVRMQHRQQLLAKLLMMDYHEQCKVPGSKWFYASMSVVESMTMDGYWQSLLLCQSVFALITGVLTLYASALFNTYYKGISMNWSSYIPSVLMICIVPASLYLINSRKAIMKKALDLRMDKEQAWVETLSWLGSSSSSIFSMGPREQARIERRFATDSGVFCKHHQKARDILNDNQWITRWFGSIAYILIVLYAGFNLLRFSGAGDSERLFTTGDFALLVKVCDNFRKYLAKVNKSVVLLQKSSVATRRFANLLNLQEQKLLLESKLPTHREIGFEISGVAHDAIVTKQEQIGGDLVQTLLFTAGPRTGTAKAKLDTSVERSESGRSTLRLEVSDGSFGDESITYSIKDADPSCIEFRDVELEVSGDPEQNESMEENKFHGLGPLGPLRFTACGSLKVPLGKVVYVEGGDSKTRLSFLALVAEVINPTRGMVRRPEFAWCAMMPFMPTSVPHLTVLEAMCLGGQNEGIARNMVIALGMDPDEAHSRLTVGQVHMLQVMRGLMRNPEVLVIARPLDFGIPTYRERFGTMLRVWQAGGFEPIVHWLANGPESHFDEGQVKNPHPRTLIMTGSPLPGNAGEDVWVNLDRLTGAAGKDAADALSQGRDAWRGLLAAENVITI